MSHVARKWISGIDGITDSPRMGVDTTNYFSLLHKPASGKPWQSLFKWLIRTCNIDIEGGLNFGDISVEISTLHLNWLQSFGVDEHFVPLQFDLSANQQPQNLQHHQLLGAYEATQLPAVDSLDVSSMYSHLLQTCRRVFMQRMRVMLDSP